MMLITQPTLPTTSNNKGLMSAQFSRSSIRYSGLEDDDVTANDVTVQTTTESAAAAVVGSSYLAADLTSYAVFADVVVNFALPVIILLGVCANMAVFCLLRQWPRRDSIHVYLSYLTLIDGLILLSGSGYTWLCMVAEMQHVSESSGWTCRLWQFGYNGLLLYTPNWLIVAMLADQLTILRWPLAARELCTRFRAHCHVIAIVIGQAAVSIHSLWTYELQPQAGGCRINARQRDFLATVWPYVSAVLCFYLPLSITSVIITLFARALCCARTPTASSSSCSSSALRLTVVVVRPSPVAVAARDDDNVDDEDEVGASCTSERRPSAVSTVVLTPTARPYGRQLRSVIALGIVFTTLLVPGIIVNVVGHVGVRWMEHPSWFPAILSCQLASCLAYASAAFIFLANDTSLRHQLLALCFKRQRELSRPELRAYSAPFSVSPDIEMLETVTPDAVVQPTATGRTMLPAYVTDV